MTNIELIDLILIHVNNDSKKLISFLIKDCNLKLKREEHEEIIDKLAFHVHYKYTINYNKKQTSKYFYNENYSQDKDCIYNYDAKDLLIEIFYLLDNKDLDHIRNIIKPDINLDNRVNFNLTKKTLEKLISIINEKPIYRKGYELVEFFNDLGFNDIYSSNFPSRKDYTYEKLLSINGTNKILECIKKVFNPINYIEITEGVDYYINDFNKYLEYDNLKVIKNNKEIIISEISADNNIKTQYSDIKEKIKKLNISEDLHNSFIIRVDEFIKCLDNEMPLSAIFLAGSILETILLNYAMQKDSLFKNTMKLKNPKKDIDFSNWVLNDFIDISKEVGLIKQDMKMFCNIIREFRNYIHPSREISNNFTPDMHTAKMCFNTLEITFEQIAENINKIKSE